MKSKALQHELSCLITQARSICNAAIDYDHDIDLSIATITDLGDIASRWSQRQHKKVNRQAALVCADKLYGIAYSLSEYAIAHLLY